jgi:methionyl-tRNA formyltransferase
VLHRPDLRSPELQRMLASTGAPLLVCYLWDRIVPGDLLVRFRQGALSYHPSLLPRHRGADPYFWTLWSGDRIAGASVIVLDPGVDTGPVVAQRSVPVPPDVDGGELAAMLDPIGLELLVEVLSSWDRGAPPSPVPQPDEAATDAPAPDDDMLEIRWAWPSERIVRLVRAAAPHPGAYSFIDERLAVVLAARPAARPASGALRPGEAIITRAGLVVGTGDGQVVIEAIRLDDGPVLRGPGAIADAVRPT